MLTDQFSQLSKCRSWSLLVCRGTGREKRSSKLYAKQNCSPCWKALPQGVFLAIPPHLPWGSNQLFHFPSPLPALWQPGKAKFALIKPGCSIFTSPKTRASFAIDFSRARTTINLLFCHRMSPHTHPLPKPWGTRLSASPQQFGADTHFFKLMVPPYAFCPSQNP